MRDVTCAVLCECRLLARSARGEVRKGQNACRLERTRVGRAVHSEVIVAPFDTRESTLTCSLDTRLNVAEDGRLRQNAKENRVVVRHYYFFLFAAGVAALMSDGAEGLWRTHV